MRILTPVVRGTSGSGSHVVCEKCLLNKEAKGLGSVSTFANSTPEMEIEFSV